MMIPLLRPSSRSVPAAAQSAAPSSSMRDPLDSPMWSILASRYLGGVPYVFDERVKVLLPHVTEDQAQVPIAADARALGEVDEIMMIVDLHPFPQVLRFEPLGAAPFLAYRQKIEQGTAIRAAARQGDLWHVGGLYLDAAGGGCSVPPSVVKTVDWDSVGQTRARAWREPDGSLRLRVRIMHPMDNGMIDNIPAFFIETLTVSDAAGAPLARLALSEGVSENPTFTLLVRAPREGDVVKVSARDNNGSVFDATVPIPPAARVREGRL